MPVSVKDGRRLTGYRGEADNNDQAGQIQRHSLYDDDMDEYQHYHTTTDDDVYEEYDEDLDDIQQELQQDDQDDTGSELSIPDPNIDFDMVYALHTFAATVEGQASVVRGDALTLLDDSNSYWWLVKVLKTAEVGYIPAENIETPHERLARLNSHRNIELTRKDIQDAFPTPPSNKIKKRKRVTLAKGVQFQSQIIYGSSDDEDDFEAEFEQWDERMRSDDSETDDEDSDEDSDDPYRYYDDQRQSYNGADQPIDMYTPYAQQNSNNNRGIHPQQQQQQQHQQHQQQQIHPAPTEYYNDSGDSDIINEPNDNVIHNSNRDTMNLEDETIKISLTPSIARGSEDSHHSDSSIQSKLKKAAKLEKLLGSSSSPEPNPQRRGSKEKEKKEKSGIRKFFSRGSSSNGGKESKKANGKKDRQSSIGSIYETASIDSQSTGMASIERDRSGSLDSTVQSTKLKIHAGNTADFSGASFKYAQVYPSTTATELIQQVVEHPDIQQDEQYNDYYLIVRALGGDEYTLVPSDKPLEIFHSLTAHLSTPMPSLKKARRISQLMGSENTHIGGPSKEYAVEDQVQFYLLSKTKRTEDGEIQIKVSLFPSELLQHASNVDQSNRVDKLVKIASSILIKDAVTLLLEKFHILNGVVAGSEDNDNIKSLRLDDNDIVKYRLAVNKDGQEYILSPNEKLLDVFGDQVPPIHYRRNSNPDRSSITVNITPPERDEIYFILKCVETNIKTVESPTVVVKQEQEEHHPHHKPHRLMRQDTPMPRQETTPTDGFHSPALQSSMPQYQPQVVFDTHDVMGSPEDAMFESKPMLSTSPDSHEDILSQLDEAIDTLTPTTTPPPPPPPVHQQKLRPRPESTESILFCNDFGMNDLMVMIRGAAAAQQGPEKPGSYQIRNEISQVFKDSQNRLDQLEKELDRIMTDAVRVYH